MARTTIVRKKKGKYEVRVGGDVIETARTKLVAEVKANRLRHEQGKRPIF